MLESKYSLTSKLLEGAFVEPRYGTTILSVKARHNTVTISFADIDGKSGKVAITSATDGNGFKYGKYGWMCPSGEFKDFNGLGIVKANRGNTINIKTPEGNVVGPRNFTTPAQYK